MITPSSVNRIELHVSHRCNLTCESCSHYANQGHRGDILPETAGDWMAKWNCRVAPARFKLLGGEPTLNPRLVEIIYLVRGNWPATAMTLVTNGFFLGRHPGLARALHETGCAVSISIHHDQGEYLVRLAGIKKLIEDWRSDFDFPVAYNNSWEQWTRRYHGAGASMEPFNDGNPRASWEICPARHCRQLHDGMLWKCPPIAYLPMQNSKFGLGPLWNPYLEYEPLSPECTDGELTRFFEQEEEPYCGMCPAYARPFRKSNPLSPLTG